jgi:uncharacterized protein YajQ (UPF0234 family)
MEVKNEEEIIIISKDKEPIQVYISELLVKELIKKDMRIKELEIQLFKREKGKNE